MANIPTRRQIDPATLIGISFAFFLVSLAIVIGGNSEAFLDTKSILIVVFGTFAVTTACFTLGEIGTVPGIVLRTIIYRREDLHYCGVRAMKIAEVSRNEGFLALDKHSNLYSVNSFLRHGVQMLIDNTSAEDIQRVMDQEVGAMAERHAKSASILRKAAEVAPAMGLIGTLIGLVQMLGSLEDTSTIGPAMAVALLTTFYGAILSYMIFTPLASKLERNTKQEMIVARIYVQSILSMLKKENPRKLEMMINGILPPNKRIRYFKNYTEENKDQASS